MAARTRSRVELLTDPVSLNTADTVALETPACLATSLIVARLVFMGRVTFGVRCVELPTLPPGSHCAAPHGRSGGTGRVRVGPRVPRSLELPNCAERFRTRSGEARLVFGQGNVKMGRNACGSKISPVSLPSGAWGGAATLRLTTGFSECTS